MTLQGYFSYLASAVYSGYNDSGYNGFRDAQHAFVAPGRFPISAMHFTPDITKSYITTFRDIRHVFPSPVGCFSFIITPFITTFFLWSYNNA